MAHIYLCICNHMASSTSLTRSDKLVLEVEKRSEWPAAATSNDTK